MLGDVSTSLLESVLMLQINEMDIFARGINEGPRSIITRDSGAEKKGSSQMNIYEVYVCGSWDTISIYPIV